MSSDPLCLSILKAAAITNPTLKRVVFNDRFWSERLLYHRNVNGIACGCQECTALEFVIDDMPYAMKYKLAMSLYKCPDILNKLSTNMYGEDVGASVVVYRREVLEKTMEFHKTICPNFRRNLTPDCLLCDYWTREGYRVRVWRAGLISWQELLYFCHPVLLQIELYDNRVYTPLL